MVWADMKAFVGSKFCRTEYELINAIAEYKKSLTPEKCASFISHLKKVKKLFSANFRIKYFIIININLGNTSSYC
jgi:hypothetical protein